MNGLDDKVFRDSWRLGSVPLLPYICEKLHTFIKDDQERSEQGSICCHVGSKNEVYALRLFLWKWNLNLSQFIRSIWAKQCMLFR